MIKIDPYTDEFKEEYWQIVNKKLSKRLQKRIMKSCIKFLPPNFFEKDQISFKHMVLAPFQKLKEAQEYIEVNSIITMQKECFLPRALPKRKFVKIKHEYQILHDAYKQIADSKKNGITMRVNLVRETGLTVCPYCNRDYINCRRDDIAGAQLDHFFNKAKYPIFSICLYNIVPSCGNCNRIKSDKPNKFVSPFDDTVDWESDIMFSFKPEKSGDHKVCINVTGLLQNNITEMKIDQAYEIHDKEIKELLEKKEFYSKSQTDEFKKVLSKMHLSDDSLKQVIFGPEISLEDMKTKPLGKMLHDLHKELKIYVN